MHTTQTPNGVDVVSFTEPKEFLEPLLQEILRGLRAAAPANHRANKSLPTMLLYNARGLELYKKITDLSEYFLYAAELDLLTTHAQEISSSLFQGPRYQQKERNKDAYHPGQAGQTHRFSKKWGDYDSGTHNHGVNGEAIRDGSSCHVIELGSGSLTKTSVLLKGLSQLPEKQKRPFTYWAIDLDESELVKTLDQLHQVLPNARIKGVRASYEEFLPRMASTKSDPIQRALLWLGSSLGNFSREEAADMIKRYVDEGLKAGDRFLIGIDGTLDAAKVKLAYGDPKGVTEAFILNGLDHLSSVFKEAGWASDLESKAFDYVHDFNAVEGCHEGYVRAKYPVHIKTATGEVFTIKKGEELLIERSYKYGPHDILALFDRAGLRLVKNWKHPEHNYALYLCEKPPFYFESTQVTLAKGSNPFGVPTYDDWEKLWAAFDCVTLDMIPESLLHSKPIDLRHICLFYIGHIPTFCQIHLSRALEEPYTEPSDYTLIFERGIDPSMEDPTICHDHSIVPEKQEDWPKLHEILAYRDRVRQRVTELYESGRLEKLGNKNRRLARTVAMVYEHEAFHLETLLYMLLQISESIRAPPHFAQPDWKYLAQKWDQQAAQEGDLRTTPLVFEQTTLTFGIDDKDSEDLAKPYEPNHVFGWDNENGIRTVEVLPFKIAPTPVSNLEYLAFLKSQDFARDLIPASWFSLGGTTFGVRVVYRPGYVDFPVAQHWPVLASGKQLRAYAASLNGRLPSEAELRVYHQHNPVDVTGSNVGLRNWHPIPACVGYEQDGKRVHAHNGGAWEWTSTLFEAYQGFSSSLLYPGYSSDFFDGTHHVILGGSWATLPRLAGRYSCRNWYQFGYPYTFATARVAWDA